MFKFWFGIGTNSSVCLICKHAGNPLTKGALNKYEFAEI